MNNNCLVVCLFFCCVKQKTAYEMRISDWSSDVCSSDLKTKMTELEVAPSRVQHSISGAVCTKTLGIYWITMGQRHNDPIPSHRQPRRNRLPHHPHRARDGHKDRRGLFGRRREGAACARGR